MSVQCEYLGRKFKVSRQAIKSLQSLELSTELDYSEQATAGGLPQLAIKGYKPQSVSLEYTCVLAVGVDPLVEYTAWKKNIGKIGEFYVGTEQFGIDRFVLRGVSLSGAKTNLKGQFLTGTINLDLTQELIAKGGNDGS